jgi:hypothetical protein
MQSIHLQAIKAAVLKSYATQYKPLSGNFNKADEPIRLKASASIVLLKHSHGDRIGCVARWRRFEGKLHPAILSQIDNECANIKP